MEKQELSKLYSIATMNAHKLIDELYENIHTNDGDPIYLPENIKALKQSYIAKIRQELDLIQTAANEASEV
jgi:1-acyl-sn-glycerol-3-phosphate acyltransferase